MMALKIKSNNFTFFLMIIVARSAIFFCTITGLLYAQMPIEIKSNRDGVDRARRNLITPEILDQMTKLPGDLGPLPAVPIPLDNPQTPAKIELGKMLFFDKRLSLDKSMSCATCHDPSKGFSDGLPRSIGFGGKELRRRSSSLLNIAYNTKHYWDGRDQMLEEATEHAFEATEEMGLERNELARRLDSIPEYKRLFNELFGKTADIKNAAKAIACFERTLITQEAPFDRYMKGDKNALTMKEKRGLALFVGKAVCSACHNGPNFTDNDFYSLGVPEIGSLKEDYGRYDITKDEKDKWTFKTPSLRNRTETHPYMHNGSIETLEEVVNFYHRGGGSSRFNKSPNMIKLHLTNQERKDLVAFLKALTGKAPVILIPDLPKDR